MGYLEFKDVKGVQNLHKVKKNEIHNLMPVRRYYEPASYAVEKFKWQSELDLIVETAKKLRVGESVKISWKTPMPYVLYKEVDRKLDFVMDLFRISLRGFCSPNFVTLKRTA